MTVVCPRVMRSKYYRAPRLRILRPPYQPSRHLISPQIRLQQAPHTTRTPTPHIRLVITRLRVPITSVIPQAKSRTTQACRSGTMATDKAFELQHTTRLSPLSRRTRRRLGNLTAGLGLVPCRLTNKAATLPRLLRVIDSPGLPKTWHN